MKAKKIFLKLLSSVLSAIVALNAVYGCSSRNNDNLSEYIYIADYLPLPSDIGDIGNFAFKNETIYFTATQKEKNNLADINFEAEKVSIFSMNVDDKMVSQLTGYSAPVIASDDVGGFVQISSLVADNEGNLWVLENWDFYISNLPADFDEDKDEAWKYQTITETGCIVRKLNANGDELLLVDINAIISAQKDAYISAFTVDNDNIYISTGEYQKPGQTVYVIDSLGHILLQLEVDSIFDEFYLIKENSVAFPVYIPSVFGNPEYALRSIDINKKDFGSTEIIPLPDDRRGNEQVYIGDSTNSILYNDNASVYNFTFGEVSIEKIFDWNECNVVLGSIRNMVVLPDNRIICVNKYNTQKPTELFILTKSLRTDLPEKTYITMATFNLDQDVSNAVAIFNRKNVEVNIEIIDYSQMGYGNDYQAGYNKLFSDIISGNSPDIIGGIQNLPYKEFISKGLLSDIYPFIDADNEISRSDFVDAALQSNEIEGKLYQIFPSFFVQTIMGNPQTIGFETGWDIDGFETVLIENPKADIPLGYYMTKTMFLLQTLTYGVEDFINQETGTACFDTSEFYRVLEVSDRFPKDFSLEAGNDFYVDTKEALIEGRQIMLVHDINSFSLSPYRDWLGGQIVFKGFPAVHKNGSTINTYESYAIMESSSNKVAAWGFLRTLLDKDWQIEREGRYGFPSNQTAFTYLMNNELDREHEDLHIFSSNDGHITDILAKEQIQEDVSAILILIDSASGSVVRNYDDDLLDIIRMGAADYFSGYITAEQAGKNIQDSVLLYLSERS